MPTQKVRYKKRSIGEAPEVGQLVRSPNAPSMRNRTVLTTGCRTISRCWFGMVVSLREDFCCPDSPKWREKEGLGLSSKQGRKRLHFLKAFFTKSASMAANACA